MKRLHLPVPPEGSSADAKEALRTKLLEVPACTHALDTNLFLLLMHAHNYHVVTDLCTLCFQVVCQLVIKPA